MAKINEIDITSLTFQEGSAPTTPASTKWKLYLKTDGLYVIDDAGTETGPLGSGGGGGDLTLIDHQELGSSASAITFSSIAATHKHLMIVARLRTDRANVGDGVIVRVGNSTVDSGTNYSYVRVFNGSSSGVSNADAATSFLAGSVAGGSADTNAFSATKIMIHMYADTDAHRSIQAESHSHNASATYLTGVSGGRWENAAAAIDVVSLLPELGSNFVQYSSATLYGLG